jgi:hypothetical protein
MSVIGGCLGAGQELALGSGGVSSDWPPRADPRLDDCIQDVIERTLTAINGRHSIRLARHPPRTWRLTGMAPLEARVHHALDSAICAARDGARDANPDTGRSLKCLAPFVIFAVRGRF